MKTTRFLKLLMVIAAMSMLLQACGSKQPIVINMPTSEPTRPTEVSPPPVSGSVAVNDPFTELTQLANEKYADEHFTGVGIGESTSERTAYSVAQTDAAARIVQSIKSVIDAATNMADMNPVDKVAMETFYRNVILDAIGRIPARERETRIIRENKMNKIYVLATLSRDQVAKIEEDASRGNDVSNKISNSKKVMDAVKDAVRSNR